MNKEFSIIANNCAAGLIYQDAAIAYKTPTIGLFFFAPCYLQLLNNIQLVNSPLQFVNNSKYAEANKNRKTTGNYYPIALLNNQIEIHFLHYKSEQEAAEKWLKRVSRLNFNNLLILFSARDGATDLLIEEFCNLSFKNKLCFSVTEKPDKKEVAYFNQFKNLKQMPDADKARIAVLKKLNFASILNAL